MAVTLVGAVAHQQAGYSMTRSYTVGSGSNRLILASTWLVGNTVNTVTYAGTSLVSQGVLNEIDNYNLVAAATGANNIVIVSAVYSSIFALISDWSGVDQTTPVTSNSAVTKSSGTEISTPSITCPTNGVVYGVGRTNYTTAGSFSGVSPSVLVAGIRSGGGGQTFSSGYRTSTGSVQVTQPSSFGTQFTFGFGINAAGGGTVYTITPSGGVALSGTVASRRTRVDIPSGGVVLAGTAAITFIPATGGVVYNITPLGGFSLAGTVFLARTRIDVPSGGFVLSGTVAARRTRVDVPSGGVVFAGTAPQIRTRVDMISGGVVFLGNAGIIFIPAGGLPPSADNRISMGVGRASRLS